MNNSNLRKSNTKRKKALSFKPTDSLNNDINSKNRRNKEKENVELDSINTKIIFMNDEEKEGYCVNKYDNGDSYFGYYANDLRNQYGFYYYSPIYKDNYQLNRFYFGSWKNDLRHGNGIYLWAREENNQKFYESFERANFNAYVGNFLSDNLNKGTYLSKKGNDYFVYHGTFAENSKKSGNNCFYYSANLEQILFGTFKDDKFNEGYISKFNDEGEIDDIVKYHNNVAENLEKNKENEKIKELITTFRDVIMSEDYFGIIFEVFSNVLKFKENYLFNIDVINTYKNDDFLDICKSYKKITIYNDIEKYVNY